MKVRESVSAVSEVCCFGCPRLPPPNASNSPKMLIWAAGLAAGGGVGARARRPKAWGWGPPPGTTGPGPRSPAPAGRAARALGDLAGVRVAAGLGPGAWGPGLGACRGVGRGWGPDQGRVQALTPEPPPPPRSEAGASRGLCGRPGETDRGLPADLAARRKMWSVKVP